MVVLEARGRVEKPFHDLDRRLSWHGSPWKDANRRVVLGALHLVAAIDRTAGGDLRAAHQHGKGHGGGRTPNAMPLRIGGTISRPSARTGADRERHAASAAGIRRFERNR